MSPIREFASHLAAADGKADASQILQEIDKAFWPGAMSRQNVNSIIRSVKAGLDTKDRRGENTPRRTRTPEAISIVAALVEKDCRITMDEIEAETGLTHYTVQMILAHDLNLRKKAARWIPRLLSSNHKDCRVAASTDVL